MNPSRAIDEKLFSQFNVFQYSSLCPNHDSNFSCAWHNDITLKAMPQGAGTSAPAEAVS